MTAEQVPDIRFTMPTTEMLASYVRRSLFATDRMFPCPEVPFDSHLQPMARWGQNDRFLGGCR